MPVASRFTTLQRFQPQVAACSSKNYMRQTRTALSPLLIATENAKRVVIPVRAWPVVMIKCANTNMIPTSTAYWSLWYHTGVWGCGFQRLCDWNLYTKLWASWRLQPQAVSRPLVLVIMETTTTSCVMTAIVGDNGDYNHKLCHDRYCWW